MAVIKKTKYRSIMIQSTTPPFQKGTPSPNPLIKEDRIEALLRTHTSEELECPFYKCDNPNVRSKCLLDPNTWRIWDCKGLTFFQGLCCEYILSAIETNSTKHPK